MCDLLGFDCSCLPLLKACDGPSAYLTVAALLLDLHVLPASASRKARKAAQLAGLGRRAVQDNGVHGVLGHWLEH